jgi:hypothetical protein
MYKIMSCPCEGRGGGCIGVVDRDVDVVGPGVDRGVDVVSPGANGIDMGADVRGVKTSEESVGAGNKLCFALCQLLFS